MIHENDEITLGAVELSRLVGRGGMGEVWLGSFRADDTPVAVKLLTAQAARRESFRDGFRNEVRSVARLDHPNIIRVYDYGEVSAEDAVASRGRFQAGTPYLVMEWSPDGTLGRFRGRLRWSQLKSITVGLLKALAHAHAHGVLHRDMKMGNVLIERLPGGRSFMVKLTDFGLAFGLDGGQQTHLEAGTLSGTPAYMAPEQFRALWREFGPWTDLYALGCMIWSLVSGRSVFANPLDMRAQAEAHLSDAVPPLRTAMALPDGFEAWLGTLMEKSGSRRFQRAADALWYLEQLDDRVEDDSFSDEIQPELLPTLADTGWSSDGLTQMVRQEHTQSVINDLGVRPICPPMRGHWRVGESTKERRVQRAGLGLFGLRQVPLVAREDERNALWSVLRRVDSQKKPYAFLLRGPSGCGKTRLARWLVQRSDELGAATAFKVFFTSSENGESAIASALNRRFLCDGLTREELRARFSYLLREYGQADPELVEGLTEWIRPGTSADWRAGDRPIRFSSNIERYVILGRLLCRMAEERPIILWLDDVQWGLDGLQFVEWLLEQPFEARILVVMTCTDEALSETLVETAYVEDLVNHAQCGLLEVGPLPLEHRSTLIQGLLGLDGELARRVEARTAGNPLFAVQLVGDWVRRGVLELGAGGYHLKAGAIQTLPDTIHEVWSHRVTRLLADLTETEATALELAAALGERVDRQEWEAVCQLAGARATDRLVDCLTRQRLASAASKRSWAFSHGMIREAILRRSQELGHLQKLNRYCAVLLEHRQAHDRSERLGRYLLAAGDYEGALEHLLVGAILRQEHGDYAGADALLVAREEALFSLGSDETDPRWVEGWFVRFTVCVRRVRYAEAAHWAKRARDMARLHGWNRFELRARLHLAQVDRIRGQIARATAAFRELEPLVMAYGNTEISAKLRWELGESLAEGGYLDEATHSVETAKAYYQALGDDKGAASCLQTLGEILKLQGRYQDSQQVMKRAFRGFETLGVRWKSASCLNSIGDVLRYQGDKLGAEQHYRQAAELFRAIGSGSAIYPEYNAGLCRLEMGHFGEARVVFLRCLPVFDRQQRSTAQAHAHLALTCCATVDSAWGEWDFHIAEFIRLTEGTGVVDEDIARMAQQVGDWTAKEAQTLRARYAYQIALKYWRRLGRDEASGLVERCLSGLG